MMRRATIDGVYRYDLERCEQTLFNEMSETPWHATFVMLNPSTADGLDDDPTIRKCIGFTKRWGLDRFFVVNLFAFRSTDPDELSTFARRGVNIIGPQNDEWIRTRCASAKRVICAWGAWKNKELMPPRIDAVTRMLVSMGVKPWCLGKTKDGQPRHPLMLSYATDVVPML